MNKYLFLLMACWFFLQNGMAQSEFEEVTFSTSLALLPGSEGIAIGDFNNDGLEDMYVSFSNGANQLCANNGDGTFTELGSEAGVGVAERTKTSIWGDLNNDGWLDLYVGNYRYPDQLFLNQGDGTFRDISRSAGIENSGQTQSVNLADIDGDGFLDIYISNFLQENVLYLNKGDLSFEDATQASGALDAGKSMGSIFFDYDQDGDADLYLVHDGFETNLLYENNGRGQFTEVGKGSGLDTQSFGMGVDVGDINQDGLPDVYITNLNENLLLKNNGDGTFSNIAASAKVADKGMGWGVSLLDYDNDGWLDIYVTNDYEFSPYQNVLYRNTGNEIFEKVEVGSPVCNREESYGTACFDFDLDGYLDIVVANRGNSDHLQLFRNAEREGGWLGLKLQGVESNRNAIGAKVRVEDEQGRFYDREQRAGHGWASQNSELLHLGLGNAQVVKELTIFWPSGFQQSIGPLDLNEFYTIEEGQEARTGIHPMLTTALVPQAEPIAFACQLSPNPVFHAVINIEVQLSQASSMQLEMTNLEGQSILRKDWTFLPAGTSQLTIDLTNSNPHLPSALYLLQLSNQSNTIVKKVILKPSQ